MNRVTGHVKIVGDKLLLSSSRLPNKLRDIFTTKQDGSTGPTAMESDGPYFEIMGQ